MEEQFKQPKVRLTKLAWFWFGFELLALLSTWPLGSLDNTTELTPDHSDILEYCFWAAGIIAVASAILCFVQSKGSFAARVLTSVLCIGLLGGLATTLVLGTVANIVENRNDFPANATRTYWALLPIDRAYRMDSRTGSSWIIQPLMWTNIDISHSDYRFMLSRSGVSDKGSEPDNVKSRGRFCAKVEMQRAGEALRVLHAGKSSLPAGTIGICSDMASREPSLVFIKEVSSEPIEDRCHNERNDFAPQEVLTACRQLAASQPMNADEYLNRGYAYEHFGDLPRAISDFDEVIRRDPARSEAYYYRWAAYTDLGKSDQAAADLAVIARLDPQLANAIRRPR